MDMRSRSPEHSDIFIEVYRYDWDRLNAIARLADLQPHVIQDAVELLLDAYRLLEHCPNHPENKKKAAKRVETVVHRLNKFLKEPYVLKESGE
jgi:hypothetical protein